jgi:hypothetical protein
MSALTSLEVRIERLRSEIAQLEARYDSVFPPGVYAVLERLSVNRRDLVTPSESIKSDTCGADRRRDPAPKHNPARSGCR